MGVNNCCQAKVEKVEILKLEENENFNNFFNLENSRDIDSNMCSNGENNNDFLTKISKVCLASNKNFSKDNTTTINNQDCLSCSNYKYQESKINVINRKKKVSLVSFTSTGNSLNEQLKPNGYISEGNSSQKIKKSSDLICKNEVVAQVKENNPIPILQKINAISVPNSTLNLDKGINSEKIGLCSNLNNFLKEFSFSKSSKNLGIISVSILI